MFHHLSRFYPVLEKVSGTTCLVFSLQNKEGQQELIGQRIELYDFFLKRQMNSMFTYRGQVDGRALIGMLLYIVFHVM